MESTNIYVDYIIETLSMSVAYLENLHKHQRENNVCSTVILVYRDGWPEHNACTGVLRLYWAEYAYLAVYDGLLLKDTKLVIPTALRNEVLEYLHEGHQDIVKC